MDFYEKLNDRQFQANFGVCKQTFEYLSHHLKSVLVNETPNFEHLLWLLYFFKVYPTEDVAAVFWKITPKTWRKHIWSTICLLFQTLNTFSFEERFKSGVAPMNMVVDCTSCPVHRLGPSFGNMQKQFYSGKDKDHVIKYEVAIDFHRKRIIWVSSAFIGSAHDLYYFS